jgi:hypothetical protein
LRNQNFNRLSCRCTPVTSANDGASCGFAIFRRVAQKWPDQSNKGVSGYQSTTDLNFRIARHLCAIARVPRGPDVPIADVRGPTSFSHVRKIVIPQGTQAETALLELAFIGFCSVSVSLGTLPEPPSGHPPTLIVRERSPVVSSGAQSTRRIPNRLPLWRVPQQ